MTQGNVNRFWRTADAFDRADVDAVVEICDPAVEFLPRRAALHGPYLGHDGIREFFADNEENLDLFKTQYTDVRDSGDRLVALGTIRIRGKGSGIETNIPSALVVDFFAGKLVRLEEHGDRETALAVAGLSD